MKLIFLPTSCNYLTACNFMLSMKFLNMNICENNLDRTWCNSTLLLFPDPSPLMLSQSINEYCPRSSGTIKVGEM